MPGGETLLWGAVVDCQRNINCPPEKSKAIMRVMEELCLAPRVLGRRK